MEHNDIIHSLFSWYRTHKRNLPWRNTKNPYKIWLSEIILQQTRIEQGLPYYLKFIDKYPSIQHIADAPIDEVVRLWQGLGYYSRVRNLYLCAKTVSQQFNGKFPEDRAILLKLPGIGPYTSAAIASFAFGKKEAVVDGNVIRFITRMYGIEQDISLGSTVKKINKIVADLIPEDNPDTFNQAIMEFGALQCIPGKPDCDSCIYITTCIARKMHLQVIIPVKSRRITKRTRYFNYILIDINGKILMRKRNDNDIWNGLFEFFLLESTHKNSLEELKLPDELAENPDKWFIEHESKWHRHILTHQVIMCRFLKINLHSHLSINLSEWENYRLYSHDEIEALPKPILLANYLGGKIN